MRTLVLCCDGTWNSADQATDGVPTPSNVRMFHNALAATDAAGHPQERRYFSGVGTVGSKLQRAVDGGTGLGLSHNIMNAYLWLAGTWRAGDRVVAVGFSRGAYTVRSLVGMLGVCGLLRARDGASEPTWDDVEKVYGAYRAGAERASGWDDGLPFHEGLEPLERGPAGRRPAAIVQFLGVWDTVGALGVPDSLGVLDLFDDPVEHGFHDTRAPAGVAHLRHAVALDERRGPFAPTLWSPGADGAEQDVVQQWFPGVHADVGGGYRETGLSDRTLQWMTGEAARSVGLAFAPEALAARAPNACDVLHDSCTGMYQRLAPLPRAVPRVDAASATVDVSAVTRRDTLLLRQDPYRPTTDLAVGASRTVDVRAHVTWGETGLWLEAGTYSFAATGEWVDKDTPAGPAGVTDASFGARIAYDIGTLLGRAETWWHGHTGHTGAQFVGTRRYEDAPWMALIGVIANGGYDPDGNPLPHQRITVGDGLAEVGVGAAGYLYAFANDAWGFYDNNRGSVTLTVTRLS